MAVMLDSHCFSIWAKTMSLAKQKSSSIGVGINYQPAYEPLLAKSYDLIDFIEFNPDALCHWRKNFNRGAEYGSQEGDLKNDEWVLSLDQPRFEQFKRTVTDRPVVAHGLSLSIGSASGWNKSYLDILDHVAGELPVSWHSEHLGFLDIRTPEGETVHAGTQLPMPFFNDSIDLLVPRINSILKRYQRPFLLENTTYYLPELDCEGMDEIDFLNCLCDKTDADFGLLFDLYNFYCNAVNFGFDPVEKLKKLNLDCIVEVHVAGGSEHKGFLLDVHSTDVPEEVWQLLQWLLPRAPNVQGVVFELLEQAYPSMTESGLIKNLTRVKDICTASKRTNSAPSNAIESSFDQANSHVFI